MLEQRISELVIARIEELGWSNGQLAKASGLASSTIHCIRTRKCGMTVYTLAQLLGPLGLSMQFAKTDPTHTMRHEHPGGAHDAFDYYNKRRREETEVEIETASPEFACPKCGKDAGVVEVAGHTQCYNCGHILIDCCGD